MPKFTPKQLATLKAINTIPHGQAFCGKDLVTAGYPFKDAARMLQSATLLGAFYHYDPTYSMGVGPARYIKSDNFDVYYDYWIDQQ